MPPEQKQTRGADYFEAIYAKNADPWGFASSPYELRKYQQTLAALPPRGFRKALEVGCSIGEFTRILAGRCENILALDAAESAIILARARCANLPHVLIQRVFVPEQWPAAQFDLIVISEVLYFLSAVDVVRIAQRVTESLAAGGVVLLVNWLGTSENPLHGDAAADMFMAACAGAAERDLAQRFDGFRIDRLQALNARDARAADATS